MFYLKWSTQTKTSWNPDLGGNTVAKTKWQEDLNSSSTRTKPLLENLSAVFNQI